MTLPPSPPLHAGALAEREQFQRAVLDEVVAAVTGNAVVVVGMGWNPVVGQARRFLDERQVPYTYIGYGNYLTGWRKRLVIKLWSGWPTFPQVFVKGTLLGGAANLKKLEQAGELKGLLAAAGVSAAGVK